MEHKIWQKMFTPQILQRGSSYYTGGLVKSIMRTGSLVKATVLGSEPYTVEVAFDGERIAGWRCSCPYAADTMPCKHLAAVLCALDSGVQPCEAPPVEDVIEALDLGTARALLTSLAARDPGAEQLVRTAAALSEGVLDEAEKHIGAALLRSAGQHGHEDHGCVWEAMRDLERFLSYAAGRLLDSQRIWDSFELTCHTLWAAYGRVTDDSDRGLTMLADTCLDLWRRQIAAAPPDLEREMFRWLGENYVSAPCGCGDLFLQSRRALFEGEEYTRENLRQTDEMIASHEPEPGYDFALAELLWQRISMMEKLGASRGEIEQFEEKHRDQPGMRERIVSRLWAEGRFSEAETLLIEGKALCNGLHGRIISYSEQLIELYEQTGQDEKLLNEFMFRTFQCEQTDLSYILKLKELVGPVEWPVLRERLLSGRLDAELYGELLSSEGLYERLLEYVVSQENFPALDRWEAELLPLFPEALRDAYARLTDKLLRLSGNRGDYAHVIARLRQLHKYPSQADVGLAKRWKNEYPRRKALLDELKKAGY